MEVLRELMKRPQQSESLAIAVFVIASLYTIYAGTGHTALLGVGFTLIVLGALPRQIALAFLVGASAIMLVQKKTAQMEGFADAKAKTVEKAKDAKAKEKAKDAITLGVKQPADKGPEPIEPAKAKEQFSGSESESDSKPMLPDNADRKEMLELGKPYKLPNEQDDKGFHLDSGTTFLNAYKALKPDQIAAMTKDTQELLATQKSLVGMLESFGPLMQDMNKITGFFGPKS
jgi:hypothetical protein